MVREDGASWISVSSVHTEVRSTPRSVRFTLGWQSVWAAEAVLKLWRREIFLALVRNRNTIIGCRFRSLIELRRFPVVLTYGATEYRSFIIYTPSSYQDDPIYEHKMAEENK
jgi:hypothetical protein